MKHIYPILIACAATAISADAQSKIDLQGRMLLKQIENTQMVSSLPSRDMMSTMGVPGADALSGVTTLSAIVLLNDGFTAADLAAAGYEVTSELNKVALVKVSSDQVEKMSELDCVRQVSFGRTFKPLMDVARANYGIDKINNGELSYNGSSYAFTGKGVCAGIYDVGIAPNHSNFKNADGTTRVKQLNYYEIEGNSLYAISIDPSDIGSFRCDTVADTHGTHTAGIMAGGYDGLVKYVYAEPDGSSWKSEIRVEPNQYKGVAPESDLLISAGVLNDYSSLDGFEKMAKYAYENGQPCVINYSVGSIMGPHDGTDAFSQGVSQVIDKYGAIFCVASGNDGGGKVSVSKTFTDSDATLKSCVTPLASYNESGCQCYIDIWGSNDKPFKVSVNSYRPKLLLGKASDTKLFEITKADQSIVLACANITGAQYSETLKNDFGDASSETSGLALIQAMSEVDENNNRFHVMLYVFTVRNSNYKSYIHFAVEGEPGQAVDACLYDIGELTAQSTTAGSVDGDDHNSINDCACNPDIISVGATYNRRIVTSFDGKISYYDANTFDAGVRAPFSSYGVTFDGRQVPEVLAPGSNVVSSANPYFVARYAEANTLVNAIAVESADSESASDFFMAMSGTSMASPFVAGTIALWLEADPTLSVSDVKEIIAKTSDIDSSLDGQDGKIGYGRINPAKGLIEVLSRNVMAIEDVNGDTERNLIITQNGNVVDVFYAGENGLTATVYNTQGASVAKATAADSSVSINTSSLASGIYVLRVEGASGKAATRKIVVK